MKKITLLIGILLFLGSVYAQEITRGQLLSLFYNAQKAQKENRFSDAIDIYKHIASIVPSLWEPYLALGVLYSADGENQNTELAVQSYKKYLDLFPKGSNDSIKTVIKHLEEQLNRPQLSTPEVIVQQDNLDEDSTALTHVESTISAPKEEPKLVEREEPKLVIVENPILTIPKETITSAVINAQPQDAAKLDIIALRQKIIVSSSANFSANNTSNSIKVKDGSAYIDGISEIRGQIIKENKKEVIVDIGNNKTVTFPASEIVMIKYPNGSNNISGNKMLKAIIKEYRKTAISLYEIGDKKECIILFERILELDKQNDPADIHRILGELYSNSTDISDLELAKTHLQQFLQKVNSTNKYYFRANDRLKDLDDRITNYAKSRERVDFLKSLEGTWVSCYYYKDRIVPMWVFNISVDANSYGIKLSKGCLRYSGQLYSDITAPVVENDSVLYFNFTIAKAYTPAPIKYEFRHLYTEITNPKYVYLASGKTANVSEERIKDLDKQSEMIHNAIEEAKRNDVANADKTRNDFQIYRTSENVFYANCTEQISINRGGVNKISNEKNITCNFLKLPENIPFVMIGVDGTLITSHPMFNQMNIELVSPLLSEYIKYEKRIKSGKPVDFKKLKYPFQTDQKLDSFLIGIKPAVDWYNKQAAKAQLNQLGKTALSLAVLFGGSSIMTNTSNQLVMSLGEILYRGGAEALIYFIDDWGEATKVNPSDWNKKMFDFLFSYYNIQNK